MDAKPVSLAYEEHGQGTPMVLVHGFPLQRAIWYPLLPLLAGQARLVLPDLRGHGQSPVTEGVYSMRTLADDLLALLDLLNIEKAILVGHSMGGYACLAFAHAYPHRLAGLALVASQAAADSTERRQARLLLAREIARKGAGPLAVKMPASLTKRPELAEPLRAMILQTAPKGMIGALKGMAERPDATDWLASITVPAVVIAGDQDALIPPERGALMAQLLGRAGLVEIPAAGHMPMMEEPQAVAQALGELIDTVITQ
jgi:3-oxoadipate enol-lactonase